MPGRDGTSRADAVVTVTSEASSGAAARSRSLQRDAVDAHLRGAAPGFPRRVRLARLGQGPRVLTQLDVGFRAHERRRSRKVEPVDLVVAAVDLGLHVVRAGEQLAHERSIVRELQLLARKDPPALG